MAERVIWERVVDHDRIARREQRFVRFFIIPAALALIAGLIFYGWQNAIGIAIVLAFFGLLVGSWVKYSSLNEKANPVMKVVDGEIVLGRASVRIADVIDYTTFATSIQTSFFGDKSRISIAKALFQVGSRRSKKNAEMVEFGWPKMDADELDDIDAALESVLPGRRVEPEDMIEPSPPRRPSRRHL